MSSEVRTKAQVEQLLQKALIIIELTNDLKEKSHIGEKYACDLKTLAWKACQITTAIQQSTRDFLQLAENIVNSAMEVIRTDVRNNNEGTTVDKNINTLLCVNDIGTVKEASENEMGLIFNELLRLRHILKKDIHLCEKSSDVKLFKTKSSTSVGDMIKTLQNKQVIQKETSSYTRLLTDDRYPEKTSKDSLLDLARPSLQTVHEDGFTDFTRCSPDTQRYQINGPSLKSILRIKQILRHDGTGVETDSTDEDLITKFSREQLCSSGTSMGLRDSGTVLKNNGSSLDVLLQNISEED